MTTTHAPAPRQAPRHRLSKKERALRRAQDHPSDLQSDHSAAPSHQPTQQDLDNRALEWLPLAEQQGATLSVVFTPDAAFVPLSSPLSLVEADTSAPTATALSHPGLPSRSTRSPRLS
jgi:hypothetical protein